MQLRVRLQEALETVRGNGLPPAVDWALPQFAPCHRHRDPSDWLSEAPLNQLSECPHQSSALCPRLKTSPPMSCESEAIEAFPGLDVAALNGTEN